MRKPRDIDAELKALAEKARGLKAKRILQLGELVTLHRSRRAGSCDAGRRAAAGGCREGRFGQGGLEAGGRGLLSRPRSHSEGPRRQVCWKGWRRRCRVFAARLTAVRRAEAVAARTDTRAWMVQRRERTRHLIELGGLVQKAGLVELMHR